MWSLEIAHDYPNCQVIGIDVVPPSEKESWNLATVTASTSFTPYSTSSSSAGQIKKENNVKFQYGDILQSLLFPDNHFDFVYQRDVATVLPFKSWPNLISEFFRVTKSGGQIQLVEYGLFDVFAKKKTRDIYLKYNRFIVQEPWSSFNSSQ